MMVAGLVCFYFYLFPMHASYAIDAKKIRHEQGFAYITTIKAISPLGFLSRIIGPTSDSMTFPYASGALLLEDGRGFGVAHSIHHEIREKGLGRFSHWSNAIIFSTPDNSSPIDNGRNYTILCAVPGAESMFLLTIIFEGAGLFLFFSGFSRFQRVAKSFTEAISNKYLNSKKSTLAYLVCINILTLAVLLGVALGLLEGWLAYSDKSKNNGVLPTLKRDRFNGWESIPEITQVGDGGAREVVFIGDSFTQGTLWPKNTIENLNNHGRHVSGYNLGVAGYGTIQEFHKLSKHIENLKPRVVILLFFAWNDMRDNLPYPGIYYNQQTRSRPYYDFSMNPPSLSRPWMIPDWLENSRVYTRFIYPVWSRGEQKILSKLKYDEITKKKISVLAGFADIPSWDPFYRNGKQNSYFVSQAWLATKYAFRDLKDLVENKHHAKLLVVGIDNAFTVDEDVLNEWVKDKLDFDSTLPLRRLGDVLAELEIPYINALPALRELRAKVGHKIYNGPAGNIAGHFEPESEKLIGELVTEKILSWL